MLTLINVYSQDSEDFELGARLMIDANYNSEELIVS